MFLYRIYKILNYVIVPYLQIILYLMLTLTITSLSYLFHYNAYSVILSWL